MSEVQGETVVARLRPHGRALVWPVVALIAIAGATGYFVGHFPESWENLAAAGVAALLALLLCFVPTTVWLSRNYTITTRRVILRRGVAIRVRQELAFSGAYDVTLSKSGLQMLFGSGDVRINAGAEAIIALQDVPRARLVQAALHDLIEANRERL